MTQPHVSTVQEAREQHLTDKVIASFGETSDPRLRHIMQALVRHAHALVREVRLTEEEWNVAIRFLADVGHMTNERRQEFILLSDVLGISMQTVTVNNPAYANATEATVFGPFFVEGAPHVPLGGDIARGAPGEPCWVEGSVTDTDGWPIPGARIDVWEADGEGLYDVQYDTSRAACRAHLLTDGSGEYRFWGITPTPYAIPHDGPVGAMLGAVGRSPMRPSHLHFMVTAPRFRTLITHIFVGEDDYLAHDAVFGVKESLIKAFVRRGPGIRTPNSRDLGGRSWSQARFDIVLAPANT